MRPCLVPLAAAFALSLSLAACDRSAPETPVGATEAEIATGTAGTPEVTPPREEATAGSMTPEAPPVASPTVTPVAGAEPGSCTAEIGKQAADRLVQRCIAVSPATRPPCNVANACEMIQGEIDRSCGMYGPEETKPAKCAA